MYKTILVPLDGSKRAEAILPHVEDLAQHNNARVILLQVVEAPYADIGPYGIVPALDQPTYERETRDAEAYLAAVQNRLRQQGIDAQVRITHGTAVGQIIAIAGQEGADLIAMASHGRTGLARVFYGSVAAGVLHAVDRPLLLVRSMDS